MIVTNNKDLFKKVLLLRNHGLKNRDEIELLGYNSRMDTFQAVVGNWVLPKAKSIASQRIKNAKFLDKELSKLSEISNPRQAKISQACFSFIYSLCKKKGTNY